MHKLLTFFLAFVLITTLTFAVAGTKEYGNYYFLNGDVGINTSAPATKLDVNGVVTSTGYTIGSAAILEAELEIIDGATLSTTQLNYLNAVTGTTGTTSTNLVFSTSPTFVTPALGTPASGTLTNCSFPTLNQNTTGSSASCTGNSATCTTASTGDSATSFFSSGTIEDARLNFTLADAVSDGGCTNCITDGMVSNTLTSSSCTGNAATVTTITGLAPDTATTQATQAAITSAANLATVGTIGTGVWNATDIPISAGGTGASTLAGASIPTYTSTNTFTNKRITSRVATFVSDATPDVNSNNYDAVTITAQAAAITDVNITGTETNFQKLIFRIKDNGTARAITWGSDFEDAGEALPTTTVVSKLLTVGFIYNTVTAKFGCVAVANET